MWARAHGEKVSLLTRVLAVLECAIFTRVGNSYLWHRACFPSSNGFGVFCEACRSSVYYLTAGSVNIVVTARAVARVMGALANDGSYIHASHSSREEEAVEVVPAKAVHELLGMLFDKSRWIGPEGDQKSPSRLSCGFSPWHNRRIHGSNAPRCFGHNGMNGCATYADPDARLSICVLKTVYDPQLVTTKSS